jgi:hypothetical protein
MTVPHVPPKGHDRRCPAGMRRRALSFFEAPGESNLRSQIVISKSGKISLQKKAKKTKINISAQ